MTPPPTPMQELIDGSDHGEILKMITLICGAAIDDGEIVHLKGGCAKEVSAYEGYRCVDCTATFHRGCMREHLKNETEKDSKISLLETENISLKATISSMDKTRDSLLKKWEKCREEHRRMRDELVFDLKTSEDLPMLRRINAILSSIPALPEPDYE